MSVGGYIDENCPDLTVHDILSEMPIQDALVWLMEYFQKAGSNVILEELGNWVYDDPEATETIELIHRRMS